MNKVENKIKKATKYVSLSKKEKALMRERLISYMEYKPLRKKIKPKTFETMFSFFRFRHYSGAFMIASLILVGTFGVTFAASDALPGDLLYGVKVNINEELKTVFISDSSRIAWERERAERRLVEAGQLAAEGRLNDKNQEKVSKLFAEHTKAVVDQVLAHKDVDPVLTAETSGEFEDSLQTHEAVLARLIVENDEDPNENAKELVEQVRSATMEVEKIREDAEEKIDITTEEEKTSEEVGTTKKETEDLTNSANMRVRAAYRAKERAEMFLKDVVLQYEKLEAGSELRLQAEAQVAFGKINMEKGDKALAEYELGVAYSNYRHASAIFQKVSKLLEVTTLFSVEIYTDEPQTTSPVPEEPAEGVEVVGVPPAEEKVTEEEDILTTIQQVRTQAEEGMARARTLLLTQEGYDVDNVEEANNRIKDSEALLLRGEIAMVLEDNEYALTLFTKALELVELTTHSLEKEAIRDKVKGVSKPPEEGVVLVLTHDFAEGVHTFRGEIESTEPCVTLEGLAFVTLEHGEQISIEITMREHENEEGCIETSTVKQFVIETSAQEEAELVSVHVNGEPVEWTVVEAQDISETEEEQDTDKAVIIEETP